MNLYCMRTVVKRNITLIFFEDVLELLLSPLQRFILASIFIPHLQYFLTFFIFIPKFFALIQAVKAYRHFGL